MLLISLLNTGKKEGKGNLGGLVEALIFLSFHAIRGKGRKKVLLKGKRKTASSRFVDSAAFVFASSEGRGEGGEGGKRKAFIPVLFMVLKKKRRKGALALTSQYR